MDEHILIYDGQGERLDSWLAKSHIGHSRSYIEKLIRGGEVEVDGISVKPSYKLNIGNIVKIRVPAPISDKAAPQDIHIDVMYEDEWLLVINKPRGMVTHPGAGNTDGTLVNALLYKYGDSLSDIGGEERPGIVHRLDKDTSGVMLAAKTNAAHERLSEMFAAHQIHKTYTAILYGTISEDSGMVDAPIARSLNNRLKMCVDKVRGKPALSKFTVIKRFGSYTQADVEIFTGRTHQIRVHMAFIGHPVAGDPVYGTKNDRLFGNRGSQLLHSRVLGFVHPFTGEKMIFETELPDDIKQAVCILEKR